MYAPGFCDCQDLFLAPLIINEIVVRLGLTGFRVYLPAGQAGLYISVQSCESVYIFGRAGKSIEFSHLNQLFTGYPQKWRS